MSEINTIKVVFITMIFIFFQANGCSLNTTTDEGPPYYIENQ